MKNIKFELVDTKTNEIVGIFKEYNKAIFFKSLMQASIIIQSKKY